MADLGGGSESPMSLTPPLSPVLRAQPMEVASPGFSPVKQAHLEPGDRENGVHLFSCSNSLVGEWPQPNGFVRSGALSRLLRAEKSSSSLLDSTAIQLFTHQFVPQFALHDHLQLLFYCAKSTIAELQQNTSSIVKRKEIKLFLKYVADFIQSLSEERHKDARELRGRMMSQLRSLLLYMGRITEVAPALLTSSRLLQTGSGAFHHFHLYLDVHCASLEITHLTTDADLGSFGFHQAASVCLHELIAAAASEWQGKVNTAEMLRCQPFTCPCVRELWLVLMHLTDHRQRQMEEESFWTKFQRSVDAACTKAETSDLPDSDDMTPAGILCELPDVKGFKLWLLSHVAPLYGFDPTGMRVPVSSSHCCYSLAHSWLTAALKESNLSELRLRSYLGSCLRLAPVWGPNTHLLILLWEHFTTRLNENFHLGSVGIDRFTVPSESPAALVDSCRKFCGFDDESLQREDSFSLFLRLLANHLSAIARTGNLQEWKQVKGRFYSKFHPRRLQSLTETGLRQLTRLFLTLALSVDGADVTTRLCDLFRALRDDPSTMRVVGRCAAIWRGHFALAHVLLDLGLDFLSVAQALAHSFDSVCSELGLLTSDPVRRHDVWRLVSLHLDSCQELMDRAPDLSQPLLALLGDGTGVGALLSACQGGELRTVLVAFQGILAKLRFFASRESCCNLSCGESGMPSLLWRHVYPVVKEQSLLPTPLKMLGDMAADFASLSLHSGTLPGHQSEDLITLIQFFCINVNVHISVTCQFLTILLSETSVLSATLASHAGIECLLFQGWFRCVMLLQAKSPALLELNRLVLQLPFINTLWKSQDLALDPLDVPKTFLRALREHSNSLGLREKMALRDQAGQWFAVVSATVLPVVKALGPPNVLVSLYGAVGRLVKHCAPLIFQESKPDCLLPVVLDNMVVPHALFQTGKSLSPALLSVLRTHLHLFVLGLAQLDFGRSPYVQRQLKNIIIHYLPKFPVKPKESSSSTGHMIHPLLAGIGESFGRSPTKESISFRRQILSLVNAHFLQLRHFVVPSHANVGLAFVGEVLRRTPNSSVLAQDAELLLMTLLDYVLLSDSAVQKEHASRMVDRLLEAVQKRDSSSVGVETLRRFVDTYLAAHTEGILSTLLNLAPLHAPLLKPLLPHLSQSLLALEAKRGSGQDQQLRDSYRAVLQLLGEEGELELKKL